MSRPPVSTTTHSPGAPSPPTVQRCRTLHLPSRNVLGPRPIRLLALLLLYAVAQSNGIIVIVVAPAHPCTHVPPALYIPSMQGPRATAPQYCIIVQPVLCVSSASNPSPPAAPCTGCPYVSTLPYSSLVRGRARKARERERSIPGAPDRGCLRTSTVDADGAVPQISHRSKPPRAMHLPTFA